MLVDVMFVCQCGHCVQETVDCPEPNYSAERNRDSIVSSRETIYCSRCGAEHKVGIHNSFGGADCTVDNGETESSCGMPYFPEEENEEDLSWLYEGKDHLAILKQNLHSVKTLLSLQVDADTEFSLLVMLHGHIVAAAEGFLSSVFISNVVNSEVNIRKLLETDPHFKKTNFSLSELFAKRDEIKNIVAAYLSDLIFHNLEKIKPMYKSVLNIDFGDISWLFSAVIVRHHCAHRAGYDKEGNKVALSKGSITELLSKVLGLAERIEEQLLSPF